MHAFASLTHRSSTWHRRRELPVERAFAEAVRDHEALLMGLARRMCGNEADAGDLVHDTYERALRAYDRYTDRGNVRSWLVAILNNLFIDRCRKARRTPRSEAIDEVDVPASEPEAPPAWASVTTAQVTAALDAIGPDFRRVYELHAAGRSYDEIAGELQIPKATVGTRLLRARKKLKDALLRTLGGDT